MMMQIFGWGGAQPPPSSWSVLVVCELCVQGCGGSGEGSPVFLVVLCDDVVRELCARAIHSVSMRVCAREKERETKSE